MGLVMFWMGLGVEFVAYLLIVMIHEFCHAEVAEYLGYQLYTIRLMPYGASLTGGFETIKCRDEVLIAIAGPLINLILAVVVAAVWWFFPVTYKYSEILLLGNLAIFFLNLIPIFPLDGGRILLALLSQKYNRQKAFRVFRIIGIVFSLLFMSLAVLAIIYGLNMSMALVAGFVFLSSIFPDKSNMYHRLYSVAYRTQKLNHGIQLKEIVISSDTTIKSAFRMLNSNFYHKFCIIQNGNVTAQIYEHELEIMATRFSLDTKVGQAVTIHNSQFSIHN